MGRAVRIHRYVGYRGNWDSENATSLETKSSSKQQKYL